MREGNVMKKLYRSATNKVLCGVCGGIAEYLEVDPTLVRFAFAMFSLACGAGILAYIVAAVLIPERKDLSEVQ